jgi:hypothetical protein
LRTQQAIVSEQKAEITDHLAYQKAIIIAKFKIMSAHPEENNIHPHEMIKNSKQILADLIYIMS